MKRILVRPFNDHRSLVMDSVRNVLNTNHYSAAGFEEPLPDGDLITRALVRALQRAGHDAAMELNGLGQTQVPVDDRVVLDGELWNFCLETQAATLLHVDLSLLLRDGRGLETLWLLEFPQDNAVPFWISLGCKPAEMIQQAMQEVEETVLPFFRSSEFCRFMSRDDSLPTAGSCDAEATHEVVPSSSWTGAEEAKTQKVAAAPEEAIPTAAWYELALIESAENDRALEAAFSKF